MPIEMLPADPALVDPVVAEMPRHLTVVQLTFLRIAKLDVVSGDATVKEGKAVGVSLLGANRDERLAPGASDLDLTWQPTWHLTFGRGMHRCVGAELARMELRIACPLNRNVGVPVGEWRGNAHDGFEALRSPLGPHQQVRWLWHMVECQSILPAAERSPPPERDFFSGHATVRARAASEEVEQLLDVHRLGEVDQRAGRAQAAARSSCADVPAGQRECCPIARVWSSVFVRIDHPH